MIKRLMLAGALVASVIGSTAACGFGSEPGDNVSCFAWRAGEVSDQKRQEIADHYAGKANGRWGNPSYMMTTINGGCQDPTWRSGTVDDVADYIVSVSKLP